MTGQLDETMRAVAVDLIDKFGKTYSVEIVTDTGVGVPADGSVSGRTTSVLDVVGAPPADIGRERLLDDVLEAGDVRVDFAARDLTFTPHIGIRITIGSRVWEAVAVEPLYSGELVALWSVFCRRGTVSEKQRT